MREHIRTIVTSARRAPWTEPAESLQPSTLHQAHADGASLLAAEAIRMAHVASVMHMDQAARLRVQMAEYANRAKPRAAVEVKS